VGTNEEHFENKDSGEDAEPNIERDKLREELQLMWYKVRLLQMYERQRLSKLIENSKLIHPKKEINGIIEEVLKEDETDITDINLLIYAAATVITKPRITKPCKKVKSRRNKDAWKIRIQRQISNWRRELSILTESGLSSDNIKLNIKKRKIFQKYKVINSIEIAQLIEELTQKVQAKAQRMRRYEKRENQHIQNKMFKEDTKQFYQYLGVKTTAINDHPHMEEVELYWKSLWEEKVQHNEKADWINREDKEKINSMNWMPMKTTETTSFLSETYDWKSP
jgi:hypothetical protein